VAAVLSGKGDARPCFVSRIVSVHFCLRFDFFKTSSPALGPEVHLSEQWTSGKVHEPVTSSPRHFYSRASESEVRPEAVG